MSSYPAIQAGELLRGFLIVNSRLNFI